MSTSSDGGWIARLDPRTRVLYLLALAVAIFVVRDARVVAGLAAAQLLVALAAGEPPADLLRTSRKLLPFGAALALTVAFFPDEAAAGWITVPPGIRLSLGGLALAGLMMLRILAVVVVSDLVRRGDPRAFAAGLAGLGAPRALATTIDVTLALLGGERRGRGAGRGTGGGRAAQGGGLRPFVRSLAAGDVAPLVAELRDKLHGASVEVAARGETPHGMSARDLGVVAGIASAMLALKILKVLPGIPFAPGHKGVLLIPLYILAGALTEMRWGATLTGATMGTIAFLMGDGRYGVFEILKHVAPGVIVDLFLPVLRRGGRQPGVVAWCVFGFFVALGRFAAVVAITLLVAAPGEMYALLAVPALVHLVFGTLSGFVSYHVMRVLDELETTRAETPPRGVASR